MTGPRAGAGSDVLFRYSSENHGWTYIGIYLEGVGCNPYPNGLSFYDGSLHVSWTNRHFVDYEGAHDIQSTVHKAQAGPNGPENNADLCYAYSDDCGTTWLNSKGLLIADTRNQQTIKLASEGITVFEIPQGSGVLNQEGQVIDSQGYFHVLNRQKNPVTAIEQWMHYYRNLNGEWHAFPISDFQPTEAGDRGSVCADREGNVYFLLPGNKDTSLSLVKAAAKNNWKDYTTLWSEDGFAGEPLVDEKRLFADKILSVFTRTAGSKANPREVVVLDFDIQARNSDAEVGDSWASTLYYFFFRQRRSRLS